MRRTSFRPAVEVLEGRCLPSANVLTYHNDSARTGDNLGETVLTPADVNAAQFGKRFSVPVDGQVYAQPLYLEGVSVPGRGAHNVVFVATEHDSVYAFDADTGGLLWHDSFINPAAGVTPVSSADVHCTAIFPVIGITATPVIDPTTGTLYVVAALKVVTRRRVQFVQQLHALDVATGAEKLGHAVTIRASVPGGGDGGPAVTFSPKRQLARAGLLLLGGVVYTSWTSFCDLKPVHGWVIGYSARTLRRVAVLNTSPDGQLATVWQSGGGLAADATGAIYFITGNGTFDANRGGRDLGDSFVKLGGGLRLRDFFTPAAQRRLSALDLDLGSGGVLLLPDQPGGRPHLLVGAGKEGTVYLLDRDRLGRFHPRGDRAVEELPRALGPDFGPPAYFDGGARGRWLYFGSVGGPLRAFALVNGVLVPAPSSQTSTAFPFPGTVPSVSADGTADGVVWALGGATPALHAYDATDLAHELYNSDQAGPRDRLDSVVKFTVPTVADGKVFVGTGAALTVFGELG